MEALAYYGSGRHSWEDVPVLEIIDAEDAIARVALRS